MTRPRPQHPGQHTANKRRNHRRKTDPDQRR
jgi:hypothetical protein